MRGVRDHWTCGLACVCVDCCVAHTRACRCRLGRPGPRRAPPPPRRGGCGAAGGRGGRTRVALRYFFIRFSFFRCSGRSPLLSTVLLPSDSRAASPWAMGAALGSRGVSRAQRGFAVRFGSLAAPLHLSRPVARQTSGETPVSGRSPRLATLPHPLTSRSVGRSSRECVRTSMTMYLRSGCVERCPSIRHNACARGGHRCGGGATLTWCARRSSRPSCPPRACR